MIQDYSTGTETPDDSDPFPELGFTLNLDGLTGPFLNKTDWKQGGPAHGKRKSHVLMLCFKP